MESWVGAPRRAFAEISSGEWNEAGDRQSTSSGLERLAEDAGVGHALRAGERAATQRTVDVDVPVGDRLRAGKG